MKPFYKKNKSQEIKKEYTREELIRAIGKIIVNDVNGVYDIKVSYKITDKLIQYVGKYNDTMEVTLKIKWVGRLKEVQLKCQITKKLRSLVY